MALLDILIYPDPRLHAKAKPVERVDDRVRKLIDDMSETMYAAPGIGLAATQVNVLERVITVDVSENQDSLIALVNPEIIESPFDLPVVYTCIEINNTTINIDNHAINPGIPRSTDI